MKRPNSYRDLSRRHLAFGFSALSLLALAPAARARPFDAGQRAIVERILQREVDNGIVPGIAWSIGDRSETLAEGAVGRRAVAPDSPMLLSTHCPLASVSKQFTAACVLLLRDDGRLSLDAPLSAYLPDYKYASRTTLRQVLTMTSGIPVDASCEAPVQDRVDDKTLVANLNDMKLDFEPGAHFAYSNCGYDLAGVVVARVSGMPFDRFIEERVFRPLAMSSSYMLGNHRETNFAEGYAAQGGGWKPAPLTPGDRLYASGNLASTAGDMQRWNRAILNATLLPRATLKEMFTVPALGSAARSIYAAGLFIEPNGAIWHAGGLAGYGTVNILVPASGHAIVLLGNTMPHGRWKPWDVGREIYNALALGPAMAAFEQMRATTLPK